MTVYEYGKNERPCGKRVVALGFFDGMHLGHTALLSAARREARRRACPLAVFRIFRATTDALSMTPSHCTFSFCTI